MAWGLLCRECQEFHGICIQDRIVTPKIEVWASAPISHPLFCGLAVSRMKRGGIEKVMVNHVQASLVWSILCFQNAIMDIHTLPVPLHWTSHPLSSKEALENVWVNAQSFQFTHPRAVSPVWHCASNRQSALCCTSSVSLSPGVCSSRVVVVHLAWLVHMIIQRGVSSVGAMRKS